MHELPRLAYCGPIASPGTPARGGYEAANRRLIDDLRDAGMAVKEYPYAPERRSMAGKAVAYATNFTALAARMLGEAGQWDILHITPLRRHFTIPEAVVCMNAKARGRKLVVDIRAGNFMRDMTSGNRVFAATQARVLRRADLVLVEGLEYVDFARGLTDAPVHYLPNYVTDIPCTGDVEPMRNSEPVRLVFLARVVPEKGIEEAIDCVRAMMARGKPVELSVLGRGDDAYVERLETETRDLPVTWHGAVAAEKVRETIRGAHFFIFPTRHDGEGHSNALTEAMAEGLVPLCADNGFNRSIVGETGRIFSREASGADYADAVCAIVDAGGWAELSTMVRKRIAGTFTAQAVVPPLVEEYRAVVGMSGRAAAE